MTNGIDTFRTADLRTVTGHLGVLRVQAVLTAGSPLRFACGRAEEYACLGDSVTASAYFRLAALAKDGAL